MVRVHSGPPFKLDCNTLWGHSSAGRAPALHAGGQEFDPPWLHQFDLNPSKDGFFYIFLKEGANMNIKKFFGNIAFYKEVISIALPIMISQFVTSFVNLIDNVMIGSVGASALTSVTVANKYYMLFNSTMFGFCGAAGIFISQFFGAKNNKRCQEVFDINMIFCLISSFLFTFLAAVCPSFILGLFTKTPEIMNLGLDYMNIIKFSYIPYAISFTVMMALRAVAINHVQLKIGVLTVATNTILNYCLIYGNFGFPQLGVKGAAFATLIARLVEMAVYFVLLLRNKHFFKFDLKGLINLEFKLIKKMIGRALPLTLNEILFSLALAFIFKAYMRVDEYLVAAITVVDTVMNIAFIIFGGLSSAVSIMIGKKLGANLLEEAKGNALKLEVFGAMIGAVIGLILIVTSTYIPHIYNLDADINHAITTLLRIKGVLIPVYVINCCGFFICRAGGDVRSTMIMDSGFLWCVNVSVATILSIFTNISLITLFLVVESLDILKMFLCIYYLKKGNWVNNLTEA